MTAVKCEAETAPKTPEPEPAVLVPFIIKHDDHLHVPIGDALMVLPIVLETGLRLFLPRTFSGELIAGLTDVPLVRELDRNTQVNPTAIKLYGNDEHPLAMRHWGSPELLERFGPLNATLCIAAAMGVTLRNPVPRVRRPAVEIPGRVIIFPNGSVPIRSMHKKFAADIQAALEAEGYDVVSGDKHFDDPNEYACFIASAEYVIAPYTGPMHIAAAMGIKTVAICIGDSPWAYRPLQPNVHILATKCDRCWFDKTGIKPCGEDFPQCQKKHSPESILAAMKGLSEAASHVTPTAG